MLGPGSPVNKGISTTRVPVVEDDHLPLGRWSALLCNHRAPLDGSVGLLDAGRVNGVAAVELRSARSLKSRALPAVAMRPLLVVVIAKCALNFAFADRYGWQRDEL